MGNKLITAKEAAEQIAQSIKDAGLSESEVNLLVYQMQTTMGGFPRDLAIEAKIKSGLATDATHQKD